MLGLPIWAALAGEYWSGGCSTQDGRSTWGLPGRVQGGWVASRNAWGSERS